MNTECIYCYRTLIAKMSLKQGVCGVCADTYAIGIRSCL